MEQKSSEKIKPKTKKVRFNLCASGAEKVFLAGDSDGCVLVIPEGFEMCRNITLYQGGYPEYHL
jgi:hypothetical protein